MVCRLVNLDLCSEISENRSHMDFVRANPGSGSDRLREVIPNKTEFFFLSDFLKYSSEGWSGKISFFLSHDIQKCMQCLYLVRIETFGARWING